MHKILYYKSYLLKAVFLSYKHYFSDIFLELSQKVPENCKYLLAIAKTRTIYNVFLTDRVIMYKYEKFGN